MVSDTREEMVRQLRVVGEYILKNADELVGPDRKFGDSLFVFKTEMWINDIGEVESEISTTSRYKV